MIFLRQDNAWRRLDNVQRSGNSLSFSLAFGNGKRNFQANVSGDTIQGTANAGTQAQSWQAQRVRLFGNWGGGDGVSAFQVRRLEGDFEGWHVKLKNANRKNQRWSSASQASFDGTKLTFSAGPGKVEAKLMPDGTLSGTITSQEPGTQAVRWQAVRLQGE